MSARETIAKITKRTLLVGGAALGGGLIVGYLAIRDRPGTAGFEDWGKPGTALNAWIKITPDGEIIFAVPRAEMGQGVYTSIAMLIAEEFEVDLDQVTVEHPDLDGKYINKFAVQYQLGLSFPPLVWLAERMTARIPMVGTGGSTTIRDAWTAMPVAGAVAREMLIAAAAERWAVEPAQCEARKGRIHNGETQESLSYGELADDAALLGPRPIPPVKDRSDYRLVGKPLPRFDIPPKVTGEAEFSIDIKRPDLLYAALRPCPYCGGAVKSYDADSVKRMPGVVDIVEVENGVAVVADSYWRARTAADALDIEFDEGDNALNTKDIFAEFIAALDQPEEVYVVQSDGDVEAALAGAAQTVEAIYEAPFLAHTCMEPLNCTVLVEGERAEIWVGTQSPTMAGWGVAKGAGVESENVVCHTTYMGGGFGRRAELDWIAQASQIARAMEGRPVKFIWSREDDISQDAFRPAAVSRFKGGLDDNGAPVAWSNRVVTQSMMESFTARAMPNLSISAERDPTMTEGATHSPYAIDNFFVDKVPVRSPIQVGNWRSVGHSFNAFFKESFIDELAYAADQSPLDFRRNLLADAPRHLAVLDMVAEKAQWDRPRRTGYGRGISIHESFGTIVAEVADVFASHDGEVRVNRVVCVVDCGSVVNPDTVVAQMESGIVYGLSAVLFGEITIEDGQIVQQNFPDYEAVRMREMPQIETHIMPSTEHPGGAGEPATPPIAAAVTNAIFDAVGVRVRQLPLTRANFRTV